MIVIALAVFDNLMLYLPWSDGVLCHLFFEPATSLH